MPRKVIVVLGVVAICLGLVAQAAGSVQYKVVVEMWIGDSWVFPMSRDAVQEALGQPDQVEAVPGFPAPMEIYFVEGNENEEVSHIYFVYGAGEDGNLAYASGYAEKGVDLDSIMAWEWTDPEVLILREDTFAVRKSSPEEPIWELLEERTFQGELLLFSTEMYPKDLISYVGAVYGESFKKPLEKALQELSSK